MATDEEMKKTLGTAKILHLALLSAVLIYLVILIILPYTGFTPIFSDDPILTLVTAVLGILGVANIVLAYFLPQWMIRWFKQKSQPQQGLLSAYIVRCAFLESVAIYGLILGILGTGWEITLPFFIVAAGAMILVFPNEEKWKKLLE